MPHVLQFGALRFPVGGVMEMEPAEMEGGLLYWSQQALLWPVAGLPGEVYRRASAGLFWGGGGDHELRPVLGPVGQREGGSAGCVTVGHQK